MGIVLSLLLLSCGGGGGGAGQVSDDLPNIPPGEQTGSAAPQVPGDDQAPNVEFAMVDVQFRNRNFSDNRLDIDPVLAELSTAQSSIDLAVMRINRQELVDLLVSLAGRVRVRVVTEKAYFEDPAYRPFYLQLINAGINVHTDKDGFPRLMHSRFVVIDNAVVITGNYDFSTEGVDRHIGDVVIIRNTQVAQAFATEFNQMFAEGNFGIEKRRATQQTFVIARDINGNPIGTVDVFFGPVDNLRDQIASAIQRGSHLWIAVKQFNDQALFRTFQEWYSDPEDPKGFFITVNDPDVITSGILAQIVQDIQGQIGGAQQTQANLESGAVNVLDGQLVSYPDNTLNLKYIYIDAPPTIADGSFRHFGDSLIITTANFTPNGMDLNDEVMLVFRGDAVVSKYVGFINPSRNVIPQGINLDDNSVPMRDYGQIWSTFYAYPTDVVAGVAGHPVPMGVVFGKVIGFTPTITVQQGDQQDGGALGGGQTEEVPISVSFEVTGTDWFSGQDFNTIFGGAPPVMGFERSEVTNPDFTYLQVVPAGRVTITITAQTVGGGALVSGEFQPTDFEFLLGPGAVREINLSINTRPQQPEQGGGLGGGGGGGGLPGGGGGGGFPGGGGGGGLL